MEIIVVSGFLGAGKTTFILEYAKEQSERGKRIAILVNEFGDLSIDGDVIRRGGLEVVELPSGCICCSLRASLPETIDTIFEQFKPDVLLIEPSGIATPENVISGVKNSKHAERYRIMPLICIVDASSFNELIDDFGRFYREQIEAADVVLINKVDMVKDEEVDKIESHIRKINPYAMILKTVYSKITAEDWVQHKKAWKKEVKTSEIFLDYLSLIPKRKFRREELEKVLEDIADGRYGKVVRAKGFVESDGICMFQLSGRNYEIVKLNSKEGEKVELKAVFIGKEMLTEKLREMFE